MVVDVVDKGAIAVGVVVLAYGNAEEVVGDAAIVVGLVVLVVGKAVRDGLVRGVLNATLLGQ
jgi:hypothetical protein